jgi:hypothetical protein
MTADIPSDPVLVESSDHFPRSLIVGGLLVVVYVLKPDVHAPVCDLGMVGSSHTVSIGLRLTVVSNFLGASGRVAPGRLVGRGLPAAPTVRRQ